MNGHDESDDAPRTAGGEPPRARPEAGREWELFVREAATDPLRHVGSVSAPNADVARNQAESLFEWSAEAMWLCPADEVRRVGGRSLDGAAYADEGDGESAENAAEDASAGDQTASGDDAETEVSG